MTRISAPDHIMILLRQKLERAAASFRQGSGKTQKVAGSAREDGSNIHVGFVRSRKWRRWK